MSCFLSHLAHLTVCLRVCWYSRSSMLQQMETEEQRNLIMKVSFVLCWIKYLLSYFFFSLWWMPTEDRCITALSFLSSHTHIQYTLTFHPAVKSWIETIEIQKQRRKRLGWQEPQSPSSPHNTNGNQMLNVYGIIMTGSLYEKQTEKKCVLPLWQPFRM